VSGLRASGRAAPQVEMVVRVTEGDPGKMAPMVAEVLSKNVSVFVANGPAVLQTVQAITKTLPIVAIDFESDPISSATPRASPGRVAT
jgi:hypothetical protein